MNNEHADKSRYIKRNQRKFMRKPEKSKRKRKGWKRVLLVIALLLVIGIGWFVYKSHKNGGGLSGMLATAVGHDEYTKKNLKELKVLILGVSTDLDSTLTDTIMVASYNSNTQKASLLSIPRDTYTGKNEKKATASQKINSLFNIDQKPERTLKAVNDITGLDIQHYIVVRTEALIKLVDAIGGVEFNVPIDMDYDDPTQDLHIHLQAGTQRLDGAKAEQLLRFRHSNKDKYGRTTSYPLEYGDNDFGRMRTQQDFIAEVLKQTLKPGNIFKLGEILEIAHENVETNIELSYIKDYVPYAVDFSTENLQTATLPGGTPDISETNNVSIFVVNKAEAEKLIKSMFYVDVQSNEDSEKETNTNINNTTTPNINAKESNIKIELINGTGDNNSFEKAKELLEDAGYEVKKTGTTSTISKTVITNKKDVTETKLKDIKTILGVGSISTNKSGASIVDLSIILGKDFK